MDIIKSEPESDNEIDPLSSHCEFQLVNIKYEDQSEEETTTETTLRTPRSESRSSMDIKKEEYDSDTEAHCISSCSEDQLTDMKQEEFLVPVPIPALESETNYTQLADPLTPTSFVGGVSMKTFSEMDSEEEEQVITSAAYVVMSCGYLLAKRLGIRKRRRWMLSLNKNRSRYRGTNMLEDLNREPSGKFENFCQMSATDFEYLLNKVGPHISKKDTRLRKAIPANERLAVTLRFLASGHNFTSLASLFKISNQAVSVIVHEVCNALIHELQNEIKMPTSPQEWLTIEKGFREQWHFPHCVGAIDGKHVVLQSPLKSGSKLISHKDTFSVVLMAVVDASYCFIFTDIGCQGRISEGEIFQNCVLFKKMNENQLMLPPDEPLPSKTLPIPHVFVADDAFPLSRHIMKPFAGTHDKGSKERAYNYRLSRAHHVVENAFGIMESVFRVFRKPMLIQPDKATNIIMTCVLLHNFLRKSKSSSSKYTPPGTFDTENEGREIKGSWRQDQHNMTSMLPLCKKPRKSADEPRRYREEFADYFVTNGKVPWQN